MISVLTAVAGIVASYKALSNYQVWGRGTLVIATVISLVWVMISPIWQSIVSLLGCAIGAIASFGENVDDLRLPPISRRIPSKSVSTSKISLRIFAWLSWLVVWYTCLYWGFESYIPELFRPITEVAAPMPHSWFAENTPGYLIWISLTGFFVAWSVGLEAENSPFLVVLQGGIVAVIISVLSAWMSYLVYVAHGWNLNDLAGALFVMILAHLILVGFFASIGMAVFGIGVAVIWTGIMLLFVWVSTAFAGVPRDT